MAKAFCLKCGRHQDYHTKTNKVLDEVRDVVIEYTETVAICSTCGSELYTPTINDINVDARLTAYYDVKRRVQNGQF